MEWKPFNTLPNLEYYLNTAKRLVVLDDVACDGRPILQVLLCNLIKRSIADGIGKEGGTAFLLLSLDQSIGEYAQAMRRLGVDLNLVAMQNRFFAMDAITPAFPPASKHKRIPLEEGPDAVLEAIKSMVDTVQKSTKGQRRLAILLDGCHLLHMLAWSPEDLGHLMSKLEGFSDSLIVRYTLKCFPAQFGKALVSRSEVVFIVKPLYSGASKNAHGQVIVCDGTMAINRTSSQSFLFKTVDNMIMICVKNTDPSLVSEFTSSGIDLQKIFF